MLQKTRDPSRPLHVTGLRLNELRAVAVFGLTPEPPAARGLAAVQDHGRTATRQIQVLGLARPARQQQRELADPGVAAALAMIVPESGRPGFRRPSALDAGDQLLKRLGPLRVAGDGVICSAI